MAYFYDSDFEGIYFGAHHPMKPHRYVVSCRHMNRVHVQQQIAHPAVCVQNGYDTPACVGLRAA